MTTPSVDQMPERKAPPKHPLAGIWGGIALILTTLAFSYGVHGESDFQGYCLTVVIGLTGVAIGWIIGFFASPYPPEVKPFSKFASLISAFFSGYVLSKLDGSVGEIADGLLQSRTYGLRIGVLVVCCLAATISTYIFRTYYWFPVNIRENELTTDQNAD